MVTLTTTYSRIKLTERKDDVSLTKFTVRFHVVVNSPVNINFFLFRSVSPQHVIAINQVCTIRRVQIDISMTNEKAKHLRYLSLLVVF